MAGKASASNTVETTSVIKCDNSSASGCKLRSKIRRSKSVGESDKHVVLLLGNSSSSPGERVCLIDHILESIVLSLDRKTLLNSRLLSSRWSYFCSKALQKEVRIVFAARQLNRPPVRAEDLVVMRSRHGRSVQDLIAVMDNSSDFPSTSFAFYNSFGYYNLDEFFNSHGHCVKKYENDGRVTVEEMRQLLLNQAPNLETLLLKSVTIQTPDPFSHIYCNTKLREASTPSYLFDGFTTMQIPIFTNLQVFECNYQLPEIFVQQLLYCSPNLIEVSLPEEYLHNLLEPVDRVHLLKELKLALRYFDFHPLDDVLNYHPDRLGLRRITFAGSFNHLQFPTNAYLASFGFMRRLLKASAATCQKLKWHGIVKHFEIPRMSRVTHIVFQINIINGGLVSVFEKGVILGDTFPNLKLLEVQSDQYIGPLVPFRHFFGFYNNDPAPVTSVRNVIMTDFNGPQEHIRDIRHMFPNAYVHGWYITMLPILKRVK